MKKRISILGCGWLGKPLAEFFLKKGYSVKGSVSSEKNLKKLTSLGIAPFVIKLETLPSDILNFLDAEILIVAVPTKDIIAFQSLIDKIDNSSVTRVIFISSTSVYCNSNKIVTEQSTLKASPLVEIETLFKNSSQFSTTIIRFGGLIGYDRNPAYFFSEGKKIPNPEGYVNMIHRDDCIQIIEQIIEKDIWNETLNACADTHPNRRDFYTKIKKHIGQEAPLFIEGGSNESKIISNEKLKSLLAYKFNYPDLLP